MKGLLFLAGLLALWVALTFFDRWTTKPTSKANSFEGFLATMREPSQIEIITHTNGTHILVTSKMPPLWLVTIPSGNPCYVYDKSGTLTDWTADSGDDSKFQQRWLSHNSRERVSIEQAREMFTSVNTLSP
jgi:hypothetical protein